MKRILLSHPQIGRQEKRAVVKVLKSGNLAQGPEVSSFEREFSRFAGGRDCVAVNSGTSALLLCLLALGIKEGDEVIVPSFTFAATANVVSLVGATPVFVDINPKTFNINSKSIIDSITPLTKAIIVVHLFGLPADMGEIVKIARDHSLFLIEDAAQAHMASIGNEYVGTFGDAAAFSFYPTKNMTSGEGGMVVLSNPTLTRNCRLLRNQGMEVRYQNEIAGYNLRMTDIHASIGRVQLTKLESMTLSRIENANFLIEHLETQFTPHIPSTFLHVFHQFTIRVEKGRQEVIDYLSSKGISSGVYYPTPVHKLPTFHSEQSLFETEKASREVLSLPIHPRLTKRNLSYIANTVNKALEIVAKK